MLLPLSYSVIADKIMTKQLANGVHMIFIDDPYSKDDAFALNLPVGYFNEKSGDYSPGMAHLMSTGLLNYQRSTNSFQFNRTRLHEAQATTWSALSVDLLKGLELFWEEFTTFSKKMSVADEAEAINFR